MVGKIKDSVPLTRQRCVEVAAPYEVRVNKFVQTSRADDIRPYTIVQTYYYDIHLSSAFP